MRRLREWMDSHSVVQGELAVEAAVHSKRVPAVWQAYVAHLRRFESIVHVMRRTRTYVAAH